MDKRIIWATDVRGTLAMKRTPISAEMAEVINRWARKMGPVVIVTAQDIKNEQVLTIVNAIHQDNIHKVFFYTNNGAFFCYLSKDENGTKILVSDEEYACPSRFTEEENLKIINDTKMFIIKNKIPLNPECDYPTSWSGVQISLWCLDLDLIQRQKIAHELKEYLIANGSTNIDTMASGMNGITISKGKVNKLTALKDFQKRVGGNPRIIYTADEFAIDTDRIVSELSPSNVQCLSCDSIDYIDRLPKNVEYIGYGADAVELRMKMIMNNKKIYGEREDWFNENLIDRIEEAIDNFSLSKLRQIEKLEVLLPSPTEKQIDAVMLIRVDKGHLIKENLKLLLSRYRKSKDSILLAVMPKRVNAFRPSAFAMLIKEIGIELGFNIIEDFDFTETNERRSLTVLTTEGERERALQQANAIYIGPSLEGKIVVLFDDIATSGTSLMVASEILFNAGAYLVFPVVILQSPPEYILWEKDQARRAICKDFLRKIEDLYSWIEATPIFRNIIGEEEIEKQVLIRYKEAAEIKKIFEDELVS